MITITAFALVFVFFLSACIFESVLILRLSFFLFKLIRKLFLIFWWFLLSSLCNTFIIATAIVLVFFIFLYACVFKSDFAFILWYVLFKWLLKLLVTFFVLFFM